MRGIAGVLPFRADFSLTGSWRPRHRSSARTIRYRSSITPTRTPITRRSPTPSNPSPRLPLPLPPLPFPSPPLPSPRFTQLATRLCFVAGCKPLHGGQGGVRPAAGGDAERRQGHGSVPRRFTHYAANDNWLHLHAANGASNMQQHAPCRMAVQHAAIDDVRDGMELLAAALLLARLQAQ